MANEAIKVELFGFNNDGDAMRFTCASGTAITKGTLLSLSDPRTAAACTSASSMAMVRPAGIAAMDKSSTDGSTSITAWTNGVFDMVASGNITVGSPVGFISDNHVMGVPGHTGDVTIDASGTVIASAGMIAGYALETATTGERINVRIRL